MPQTITVALQYVTVMQLQKAVNNLPLRWRQPQASASLVFYYFFNIFYLFLTGLLIKIIIFSKKCAGKNFFSPPPCDQCRQSLFVEVGEFAVLCCFFLLVHCVHYFTSDIPPSSHKRHLSLLSLPLLFSVSLSSPPYKCITNKKMRPVLCFSLQFASTSK